MNTAKFNQKIRWMVFLVLAVVILTVFTFPTAPAAAAPTGLSSTCKNVIQDYVNWAKNGDNMVDMQWSGLNVKTTDPNARHEFGYGRWGFARLEDSGNTLHGFIQEYFSDRTKGQQKFYYKSYDWTEISISPKNGVTLHLYSWGNGEVKVTDLSCSSDGFIMFRWPGTMQMITIVLVKTYY
ncbi:MAG: hypothetical protein HUU38_03950 [Anaerolineales bacterium]|nr:hypothetical protein [Anaerolineales bacterium]